MSDDARIFWELQFVNRVRDREQAENEMEALTPGTLGLGDMHPEVIKARSTYVLARRREQWALNRLTTAETPEEAL